MTDNRNNPTGEDQRLARLLKQSLPDAPHDPWFTRKVLNRLPDRSRRIAAAIEYLLYGVGAIICGLLSIKMIVGVFEMSSITINDAVTLAILISMAFLMLYGLIAPLTRTR